MFMSIMHHSFLPPFQNSKFIAIFLGGYLARYWVLLSIGTPCTQYLFQLAEIRVPMYPIPN